MSDTIRLTALERVEDAVRDYARGEVRSLTRRAIYRLQRIGASGVYGGDYRFKSLWDEYCHEVQDGPYDLVEDAWEDVLSRTVQAIIESIPRKTAVLLTILAVYESDDKNDGELVGSVWQEGIARLLREQLADEAGSRGLDHLNPL